MAELTSRHIGKYQIQAELGRGGFGTVYRAYDPTVGRLVAIKVLTAAGDQQLLTRFKNEAAAAGNLRHKNIITIYDFGEHEGLPYIVMEFLEGEDLQQVISQNRPLPLLEKVSIMLQVADGLQCAHRSGVVHRDVKPGNIRLLADGTVKLMDFGIARVMATGGGAARLTRQGHVIGTLLYMSPEQVRGGDVDFLCDIFAYGITYYELLAGRHPFQGSDPRTVFYRITTEDPEPIRNIVADCPEALEAIVSRTLQKERELRYQSLREVQLDTEPLLIELRQERATTLLAEATKLYNGGQLDSAQAVLNEAFDLEPGNRGARQLRETIQHQLLRRVIEPKIQGLLEKGEGQLLERRFLDAMESFEAALRLDRENAVVLERLNRARELLNISRETARMVADARREFTRNNLDAALQTLPETLELDPGNPEAKQLLDDVRKELVRRERERDRGKRVQQARDLLAANRFDDALRQLDGLDANDESGDTVGKLASEIRSRKHTFERQQKVSEELAVARQLMHDGQHEKAIRRLERLMNAHPDEPEATKLFIIAHKKLAAQRKAETLDRLGKELVGLVEAREFQRALEVLDEALREYPAEQRLLDAVRDIKSAEEEYQRTEAVREALESSQSLVAQGRPETAERALLAALDRLPGEERLASALADVRAVAEKMRRNEAVEALCREAEAGGESRHFDGAIAALEHGIQAYGEDPRLTGAKDRLVQARAAWQCDRAVGEALTQYEQGLSSNDPELAIGALEAALREYPGEQRLSAPLAQAREALAAKRRDAAIYAAVTEARAQVAKGNFEKALGQVSQVSSDFGPDERLAGARQEIVQAREAWERSEAIRTTLEQAERALQENDPENAIALLDPVAIRYPDDERLSSALQEARSAAVAKQREEAIEAVCRSALSSLEAHEFDHAVGEVERGLESLGSDLRLAGLRVEILASQADWERREAVRGAIEKARAQLANGDAEGALESLAGPLGQYSHEERLAAVVSEARAAIERQRRERAIQAALSDATARLQEQEFDRAAAIVDEAGHAHGHDERLASLYDEIGRSKAQWERSECVRLALGDSERQLAEGDADRAVASLEAALDRYPDEEALLQSAEAARAIRDNLRREAAIESVCREASADLDRREFDRALDSVKEAIAGLGHDERLSGLKSRIVSARMEWHRAETVRRALQIASESIARGEPEAALEVLEAALGRYAGDEQLTGALAGASQALESKQREARVEAACRQAGSRLERSEFDSALAELDEAEETLGADPRLAALRIRLTAAKEAHEREAAVLSALAQSEQRLSEDDPASAIATLASALDRYPGEERLESAAAAARRILEERRREAAIGAVCDAASHKAAHREFDAALQALAQGIADYGSDPRLLELQKATAAAQADWQRSEAVRAVLEQSEQRLSRGEPDGALQLLEAALKDFPGDQRLVAAAAASRDALESKQRAAAIERLTKRVRQCLKRHEFEAALADIGNASGRYPDDTELAQLREKVAAARADWEREQAVRRALLAGAELQAENHFPEALRVLQETLARYPGEPRLVTAYREIEADYQTQNREESLRAAIDEANRVLNDDPDRAVQLLEAALKDNPGEPNATTALERARQVRAERLREQSIDSVCRETRLFLQSRDFEPALKTIERGLEAIGEEARLAGMRETVLASKADWERAEGIRRAVEEADRYAANGELATAVESLVSATKVYGPEELLTEALASAKDAVEKKRRSDQVGQVCRAVQVEIEAHRPDEAESMLRTAEATHGVAAEFQVLHRRIDTERAALERAQAVRQAVEEATALLDQGEPARAVSLLDAALAQYTGDRSLLELRNRAGLAWEAKRKEEALDRACLDIQAAIERGDFKAAEKQINLAVKTHGGSSRLEELRRELAASRAAARRPAPVEELPSAPVPREPGRNKWAIRVAAGVLVVAAAIGAAVLNRSGKTVRTVQLQIQTAPSNANVKVADRLCASGPCRFDLEPGIYRVQVSAEGFEPKTEEARIVAGDTGRTIAVTLTPLRPAVQISANFAQGAVVLDGASKGSLQDGQFALDGLQPGRHDLRIASPDGTAALSFQAEAARLPTLHGLSAEGVDAIAVGTFGNQVSVACGDCSGDVFVDERRAGGLTGAGITVGSLSPGTHRLRLAGQSGERNMVFTLGGAPAISLAIMSNRNFGTLVIEAGEDGASVFIDGRRIPRRTVRGQLRLPIEAREHTIRVVKEGYRAEPAELRAVVGKGDQMPARFRLTPEAARLVLADALPGAGVRIDGKPAGNVAPDGSFSAAVAPGEHHVELLRDGFTPTSTRRNFSAGGTVQLGRVETHMAALPAAPSSSVGSAARTATPAAAPESPKPDPVSPELADWQRVSKNPTAGELEEFLQKYPSGSNAAEAQRALERLDWSATNKSNWVSLQAYLAKHPSGPNAAQAAVEIARIDRDATARQQVQQDAERLRAERDEIRALLRSYGEAYTHKDANQIAALWPSMPARNLRDIRASFRDFQTLKLELRPLSEPEIAGASARVACRRVTDAVDRNGSHPTEGTVTVQFAKQNGRWVIDAIQ